MGQMINLKASDGFELAAYVATPAGKPRGALIVVQEIFGVNHHIKAVADSYAADGYVAIAPSFFDRVRRNFDVGYSSIDMQTARELVGKVNIDTTMLDVAAALAHVKAHGKTGIIGYCWGGRVSWVSAARVDGLACAVSYYGGGVPGLADLQAKAPVMFHWGELDHAIPLPSVEEFIAKHPEAAARSFIYTGAQHGFACDERGSWNEGAARQARERSVAFLQQHIG